MAYPGWSRPGSRLDGPGSRLDGQGQGSMVQGSMVQGSVVQGSVSQDPVSVSQDPVSWTRIMDPSHGPIPGPVSWTHSWTHSEAIPKLLAHVIAPSTWYRLDTSPPKSMLTVRSRIQRTDPGLRIPDSRCLGIPALTCQSFDVRSEILLKLSWGERDPGSILSMGSMVS